MANTKGGPGLRAWIRAAAERSTNPRGLADLVKAAAASHPISAEDGSVPLPVEACAAICAMALEDKGELDALRALLDLGFRADARLSCLSGATLLHYAGTPGACALLKERGADVEARDDKGATPLMLHLARPKRIEEPTPPTKKQDKQPEAKPAEPEEPCPVVAWLLKNGAKPDSIDSDGNTPFFYATSLSDIQALLDAYGDDPATHRAKLAAKNRNGEVALHHLAACADVKALAAVAHVTEEDPLTDEGRSPIEYAVAHGNAKNFEHLAMRGAAKLAVKKAELFDAIKDPAIRKAILDRARGMIEQEKKNRAAGIKD